MGRNLPRGAPARNPTFDSCGRLRSFPKITGATLPRNLGSMRTPTNPESPPALSSYVSCGLSDLSPIDDRRATWARSFVSATR